MAIRTIADDTIDPGHEQESAPRFPQLGVLEEARRRPGFPGSELAWAPDRSSRFALTTLWESTGCLLGLADPATPARSWRCLRIPGCRTRWCVPTAR